MTCNVNMTISHEFMTGESIRARIMTNKLRVLRAEHAWSQGELSQRLGVSRQAVNAIETGKHDPSLELAFRIAHLFGLTVEEVFQPSWVESPARPNGDVG